MDPSVSMHREEMTNTDSTIAVYLLSWKVLNQLFIFILSKFAKLLIFLLSEWHKYSALWFTCSASPATPVMSPVPTEVDAGSTITVSCSVKHSCSSHPPEFLWSVSNLTSKVTDTSTEQGIWERTSTITFMVTGRDGVHSLTCTATFWRGKQQASSVELTVKG